MYKLTRCVKKHKVREAMKCHLAFLMRFSRCHVGVINSNHCNQSGHNLVYNGKYWILHPGIPKYSNKVTFFYWFYLLGISYTRERLEINMEIHA